jgi:capsular polysaccharide export protein
VRVISGDCDPWHIVGHAAAVVAEADDELRLIAALDKVPTHIFDSLTGHTVSDEMDPATKLAETIGDCLFENPFTREPMTAAEAVELCGFWRKLIDSNRDIGGGLGFAFWKQDHIAPLLWDGTGAFRFLRSANEVAPNAPVAVWRAKIAPVALSELQRSQNPLIEVEDGFLRSRGLGADCIPPLSVTIDRLGAHFDPSQPSELEVLLQEGEFDEQILARAAKLRRLIVEAGIGKYEQGGAAIERSAGTRRHILVPGQVEDDRAVQLGGCGLSSNLDLLRRVRAEAPDAYILYKPHPDVLAGHRLGSIPKGACLEFADQIVGDVPIASLIGMVDEVHVNTSLAGFEALLRDKMVTTYGVPFYAGWGLTRDLGPVPSRRTARRSLNELIAATLLIYPRYFDPITGLPCPAEVVVKRLSGRDELGPGLLVGMRRLQGAFLRRLRSLGL